jgi:hypothetical protein
MISIVAHQPDQAPTLDRKHPDGRLGRYAHARILRHSPTLLSAGYLAA